MTSGYARVRTSVQKSCELDEGGLLKGHVFLVVLQNLLVAIHLTGQVRDPHNLAILIDGRVP
jgi:hypothetical protein